MGSFETNLHLAVASTSVPYTDLLPQTVNGVSGIIPVSGRRPHWGLGTELDGRWAFKQLNQWLTLTTGLNGGFVTGDRHSTFFASAVAGLRINLPTTSFHVTTDAGYSLLKLYSDETAFKMGARDIPIGHGALLALGVVSSLPSLCSGCQIGARIEGSLSESLYQGRGLITIGYQTGTNSTVPKSPPLATPSPPITPIAPLPPAPFVPPPPNATKSLADTQLEDVENRIKMIQAVYHKDLKTCLSTTEEIGHFLAWTRGNSDITGCRLPLLQPQLKDIETVLRMIRSASAENPKMHARIDAAHTALRATTSFLFHKGMELLVGPQSDSRLSRIIIVGKHIVAAINQNTLKGVKPAFLRYETALITLQRIFNENALNVGYTYKAPQQVLDCLLTEVSCPSTIATEQTVPALKKRLGIK